MDLRPALVFVSSGVVHPSRPAQRRAFRAFRRGADRAGAPPRRTVRRSPGLRMHRLARICEDRPRILGLYVHHPRVEPSAVAALCRYVGEGGALLAIHGAGASFKGDRAYRDLLGASFAGHRRVSRREIRLDPEGSSRHPVLPESVCLTDEMYEHDFTGETDVWYRWHDARSSREGPPAVWTRGYGEGRVACVTTGHRAAVWRSRQMTDIVFAVLDWLLRGETSP